MAHPQENASQRKVTGRTTSPVAATTLMPDPPAGWDTRTGEIQRGAPAEPAGTPLRVQPSIAGRPTER